MRPRKRSYPTSSSPPVPPPHPLPLFPLPQPTILPPPSLSGTPLPSFPPSLFSTVSPSLFNLPRSFLLLRSFPLSNQPFYPFFFLLSSFHIPYYSTFSLFVVLSFPSPLSVSSFFTRSYFSSPVIRVTPPYFLILLVLSALLTFLFNWSFLLSLLSYSLGTYCFSLLSYSTGPFCLSLLS